jgi:small subunit ribosomal protein S16
MATKIRLQRHGRKKRAFFHIVVTDSRAPRDGRFIEKIGTYNPITNPATIDLNVDKAVQWLFNGAQPSDTARAILSYKGVLYKRHLQVGVKKGALTQEQADAKFTAWLEGKDAQVNAKRSSLADVKSSLKAEAMKAEAAKRDAIAAKVLAKQSALNAEVEEATAEASEETAEGAVEETAAEETAAEETAAEESAAEETAAEETAAEGETAE